LKSWIVGYRPEEEAEAMKLSSIDHRLAMLWNVCSTPRTNDRYWSW
jgi:hypothetical protein